jgi:hypothetical protein
MYVAGIDMNECVGDTQTGESRFNKCLDHVVSVTGIVAMYIRRDSLQMSRIGFSVD